VISVPHILSVRYNEQNHDLSGFGGLGVSVLASGTQVRGFIPGRSRRIFKGGKILSTPSFGREVGPMSQICGMYYVKDP
jgi:hypothetical protein